MVPQTFPSTLNRFTLSRQMRAFRLSSVTGLTRWVDYIPIKLADAAVPGQDNHHDADGYISMDFIDSTTGLVNGVDYVPVYIDTAATVPWQVSDTGYIPYGLSGMGGASLVLEFAKGNVSAESLDPRITFTRASSGTYFDSAGVLRSATYNLLAYSEQFDNAAWSKTNLTATAAAVISPAGTLTGSRLTEDTSGSAKYAISSQTAMTSGTTYVASFFAKNNGRVLQITFQGASHGISQYANFDLSNGTVTASAGGTAAISSVGNGWYRCSFASAATSSVTAGAAAALASSTTAPRLENYTGDGTSGIFIWGAQLEAASTAGPYYATTTAANGAPRFTYNPVTLAPQGLLIEEQRTNLLLNSENASAWTATAISVTANTIVAPDGLLTADKIAATTANAGHSVELGATVVAATAYTFSVYLKAAEETVAVLWNNVGGPIATFNLVSGTVTSGTGTITAVGNGWYRCSIAYTPGGTTGQVRVYIRQSTVYTGDGTSGIYIWGAQLEAGAFPTSYIPTVAAQATRSRDDVAMTGANFSSWYRADEGTLYVESQTPASQSASVPARVSIDDGSINNRIVLRNGSNFSSAVTVGGSAVANMEIGAWSEATTKQAIAYRVNDFAYTTNAATVQTDTAGAVPVVDRLSIGKTGAQNFLTGTIRKIAFYPQRVTNAQLQALTR